jgi:hypothetical protein
LKGVIIPGTRPIVKITVVSVLATIIKTAQQHIFDATEGTKTQKMLHCFAVAICNFFEKETLLNYCAS